MVWCLFNIVPLPEQMTAYYQLDTCEQTSVKFEWKTKYFLHENAFIWFENVSCKIPVVAFIKMDQL